MLRHGVKFEFFWVQIISKAIRLGEFPPKSARGALAEKLLAEGTCTLRFSRDFVIGHSVPGMKLEIKFSVGQEINIT